MATAHATIWIRPTCVTAATVGYAQPAICRCLLLQCSISAVVSSCCVFIVSQVTHSDSALPVLVLELVLATTTGSGSGTNTNIRNTAESSWLQLMLQLDTPNLRHGGYNCIRPTCALFLFCVLFNACCC